MVFSGYVLRLFTSAGIEVFVSSPPGCSRGHVLEKCVHVCTCANTCEHMSTTHPAILASLHTSTFRDESKVAFSQYENRSLIRTCSLHTHSETFHVLFLFLKTTSTSTNVRILRIWSWGAEHCSRVCYQHVVNAWDAWLTSFPTMWCGKWAKRIQQKCTLPPSTSSSLLPTPHLLPLSLFLSKRFVFLPLIRSPSTGALWCISQFFNFKILIFSETRTTLPPHHPRPQIVSLNLLTPSSYFLKYYIHVFQTNYECTIHQSTCPEDLYFMFLFPCMFYLVGPRIVAVVSR